MSAESKKGISRLMRSGAAAAVFIALIAFTGTEELIQALRQLTLLSILYLTALAALMIWVSSLKWQLFIRASGHDASIGRLMSLYTIGYFYNTFFPSLIGGDIARSIHLGRQLESQSAALASTFLERFTGLLAMSFLGLVFVLFGSTVAKGIEVAVILMAFGTFSLALACFSPRVGRYLVRIAGKILVPLGLSKVAGWISATYEKIEWSVAVESGKRGLLPKALTLSLIFHLLTVVNTYVRPAGSHPIFPVFL